MNRLKKPVIFSALLFLFSCGIEEYYYLPQVPEITDTQLANSATIILPNISQYYYATNYSIFYRIYISGVTLPTIQTASERNIINPELAADFNSLSNYTSPTGTSVTTSNTFVTLKYYEIELDGEDILNIFTKNGGTLSILFPTMPGSYPTVSLNEGDEIRLRRSGRLTSPRPEGDLFFRNTSELNDNANATAENNADVAAGRTDIIQRNAYVSMYIVARGNNEFFSPIYGKPTHINIFRLPDN